VFASLPIKGVRMSHVDQQRSVPTAVEFVNGDHRLPCHISGDTQIALPGQPHDAVLALLETEGFVTVVYTTWWHRHAS
jgi:hypothetical protein